MGLNWFITGGCGFIGINLVSKLLSKAQGNSIIAYDNLKVGSLADLQSVCEEPVVELSADDGFSALGDANPVGMIVGDILDEALVMKAMKDADIVVHLAANTGVGPSVENPRFDMENNVNGVFNCLEAARVNGVKRFVFASSGAPAGEVEPPIHENMAPKPVSPYGASKLAGEGYCSAYARTFGICTIALRFGNVYGPRSTLKASVVAKFIKLALSGKPLEIYGDGSQTRDFIYIEDLVRAIELGASAEGCCGEIFQIATSRETTVSEMTETLQDAFEKLGIKRPQVIFSEKRLGDVMRNFSDTTKAKQVLNWQAEESLASGIEKTVRWFLTQGSSRSA